MSRTKNFLYISAMTTALSSGHLWAIENGGTAVPDAGVTPQPRSPSACISLQANNERLACYDTFFQVTTAADQAIAQQVEEAPEESLPEDAAPKERKTLTEKITEIPALITTLKTDDFFGKAPAFNPKTSMLDQRWELSEDAKLGTWQLRAYQPMYILPVMWTSDKNVLPHSPNPVNTVNEVQDINSTEAKFQISFKTKALEDLFGNNGDVWVGYTQSSRWQVYNDDTSRPFRETNYEPEASLVFRTNYNLLGLHGRLLGVTFNHQSNGRSDPFSRSWNRMIFNVGLERENFAIMLRPWYRFDEEAKDDNNPDISDYIGRGDLTAFYKHNENSFSLMLRHSLKGGDNNRGAAQFDWAFPLAGALRGHLQLFHGYGESLIDYNHKATYVGVGASLMNWY